MITIFKTVFFSVTVDNTTVPYKKIVVNKDGTNLSIQNYPKDITKCSDIYSFTPIETGTYYICLSYNGVNVSGTFHFFNVTSVTTKVYNIFTTPNPSEYGQEITVTTFIDDTGVFAVCLFSSSESTVDYDSSLYTTFVDVGWYNYTFTYLSTLSGITNYYFRIFKQVADIYSPVGEIYIHYIRYVSKESYIDVAHPSVLIREDIGIFGNNAEVIIRVGIFNDATLIFDNVPSGFFHFSKTYDSVGTHVISLKKYVNDQWILVDSVQVIVSTPPSGDDGFFGIPIPNLRGTSMGYLIGLIIVFVFIILPMRIQKGLHIKQSLPPFVYIFTGLMGIVTSTVLPFFDVWILAFIIIMSLIYLVAKYLVGSGTTSEE
jgi:hypothetical protein